MNVEVKIDYDNLKEYVNTLEAHFRPNYVSGNTLNLILANTKVYIKVRLNLGTKTFDLLQSINETITDSLYNYIEYRPLNLLIKDILNALRDR